MTDRFVKRIGSLADAQANLEQSSKENLLSPYCEAIRSACFKDPRMGVFSRRCAIVSSVRHSLSQTRGPVRLLDWVFDSHIDAVSHNGRPLWMPKNLFDARGGRLVVVQSDGTVACRWADSGRVQVAPTVDCPLPTAVRGVALQRGSLETLCALRNGAWRLIDSNFERSRPLGRVQSAQSTVSLCSANVNRNLFWATSSQVLCAIDTRVSFLAAHAGNANVKIPFADATVHCAEKDTFLALYSPEQRRAAVYDVRCLRPDTAIFNRSDCDALQWLPSSCTTGVSTLALCVYESAASTSDTAVEFLDGAGVLRATLALPRLQRDAQGRTEQLVFSAQGKHALALVRSAADGSTHLHTSPVHSGAWAQQSAAAGAWQHFSDPAEPDLGALHVCIDHDVSSISNDGQSIGVLGSTYEWLSLFSFGQSTSKPCLPTAKRAASPSSALAKCVHLR